MKRSTSQKGLTGESERKTKPNPKGNSVEYYGIFVARSNGMKNILAESIRYILIHLPISKVPHPPGYLLGKTRYSHICC